MNDLTNVQQPDNNEPFRRAMTAPGGNIGAIAIESERAIAEAQGQLILAKRFPRSMSEATVSFLDACKSPEFAATAFYAVPNRGSGPSIRFAEEAARCYGNFEYGHRELSRSAGKSEIEVYAWDKQLNNRSVRQLTVEHIVDTKNGPKPCRDQSDIDNLIANKASKQMRGRILALMPKGMIAAGIAEAKKTIAGGNERPLSQRIISLSNSFAKYGVTSKHLEKHLGHAVDDMTIDEFTDLMGIGAALKDGGKPSEYFPMGEAVEVDQPAVKAITEAAGAAKKTQSATTAAVAAKPKANSKPAESASKPVKEAAPEPTSSTEPDQDPKPDSPPAPATQAAAPGAADEDEPDVF